MKGVGWLLFMLPNGMAAWTPCSALEASRVSILDQPPGRPPHLPGGYVTRAGVLVRLRRRPLRPPLPTILLANVQSLDIKRGLSYGDFNKANFRTMAPKYFQHRSALNHCYSPFRDAYKSLPRPPFCKSDHSSVLLLPAYRQKLKREAPTLRTIQCWSDQSDAIIQDCCDHMDWDMFRAAPDDDIEVYSDYVMCFIRKCIEDVVPTKAIRIYPKLKQWINSDVQTAFSARTSAFKSENTDDRKQASYDLRKSIKATKRQHKNKVEEQLITNNARNMWQGINNITGFTGNKPATVNIAASLPDEFNNCLCSFRGSQHRPHRERSSGCCRRGESTLHFCRGCNPILQTGEYPQSCGSGWHPRLCVQSIHIPTSWGFYKHFQTFWIFWSMKEPQKERGSFCGSFMLQKIHQCAHTEENKITCLNDWRPVALTPIFSKCFEKLIRDYICSVLPASLDPLQFAYRSNCSTDDAIAFTLHTALFHLKNKNTYVRMLFVNYSPEFNTIVPATLVVKLQTLGLNRSLCSWILDFLTGRS